MRWRSMIPVYVTRETGGIVGSYKISLWRGILLIWLIQLNIVLWSVIGIVTAARVLL